MNRSSAVVAFALCLCLGLAASASAAGLLLPGVPGVTGARTLRPVGHGHAFLQLPGMKGSSRDRAHAGWSDVLNCSLGISTPSATGARGGRSHFEHLILTMRPEKACAHILASLGRPIKGMMLDVPVGANNTTSLSFKSCILTAFSLSLDAAGNPIEQFTFTYNGLNIVSNFSSHPAQTNWNATPVR